MALFEWDETYNLGIKAIDEQHKYLVNLINDLYRLLLSHNPQEQVYNILDRMLLYATYHFQDEEKFMAENDFPFLESHKVVHQKFTDKTLEYLEKFQAGELKPSTDIAKFLKNWLSGHILGEDKEYIKYLNSKNRK